MRALRAKLRRDLWRLRYQALTIALVVACGIASFVAPTATLASVAASRDRFYADAHLADVQVHLRRAPASLIARLRAIPGVVAAEGRAVADYRLIMRDAADPVSARFVALAPDTAIDRPQLVRGRAVTPGRGDEVVIADAFARAWDLAPGARVTAVIAGRRATLAVVGVAVSPEYVYALSPRTGLPDARHFGVAWMDADALAAATGERGGFDDAVLRVAGDADVRDVIDRVDAIVAPYGGLGAVARADQPSVRLVDQKLGQLARLARSLPVIFLGVAAFLLHVLMARIVGTQREQIATLKALGYRTRELLAHYVAMALAIGALGSVLGVALGLAGSRALLAEYARYLAFGTYLVRVDPGAIAGAVAVGVLAGALGTVVAVRRAVAIPPAEAMRPEAPARYRRGRAGWLAALLPAAARMVVRDVARRPGRLALSSASIALATGLVLVGASYGDSLDELLHLHYEVAHREALTVALDRTRAADAIRAFAHVPGVRRAEGERVVPVRIHAGARTRTTAILGLDPTGELHQLLGADRRPMALPADGLALSRTLADALGVRAGDVLAIEDLARGGRVLAVPIAALVDDLLGVQGYMEARALARLLGETPSVDVALIAVETRAELDAVRARLEAIPAVAGISEPALDRALLEAEIGDVYVVMILVLAIFAGAIAVGVIYNNARIALEIRARDLATLRILGFTRGELATVLLGEQAIQVVLGLPLGLWFGAVLGRLSLASVDRELIRIPSVIAPRSVVAAACVIVLAALASALAVRRRADRLDLVAVLKARD